MRCPSQFGSHKSMVVDPLLVIIQFGHHPAMDEKTRGKVICRDEKGLYLTEPHRIDDGLADPNRHDWRGRGVPIRQA